MKPKQSYIFYCFQMLAVAATIVNPAFAFQPWENGIFPLKEQIKKIDDALSFNFYDMQAGYQTEADRIALQNKRNALNIQRRDLVRQIEESEKIHNSGSISYLAPADSGFNSSRQTASQASR